MRTTRYQFVIAFKNDPEIILSGGSSFVKIKDRLKANLVNLNIPSNAPAETPRVVINTADLVIQISFNRFSFQVAIPEQIKENVDSSMDYLLLKIDPLIKDLIPSVKKYEWAGLVTQIDKPLDKTGKSSLEVIKNVFDTTTTLPRNNRDLSTFQLQFGYNNENFNDIYFVNGYENKNLRLPNNFKLPPGQSFTVNIDTLPVTEAGLQIKVDSNNRGKSSGENSPDTDLRKLIKHQKGLILKLPEELNLKGVI